ncbi:hypothetical protein MLD38_031408 [Melastoma candidum]|uniref:Uncharacterized protein n=2 Tax=Melastoma candidum TaxID=119954 RepID=A0ACB9MPL3_9MYRT|nr:hypothetical protein MLD38_031406 [Melastoma candidum]KAI4326056.1 hypothetical protein MLD38_031408 [Melastoma candidum]
MAKLFTRITSFLFLFIFVGACMIEARPLNVVNRSKCITTAVDIGFSEGFFDGLLLGAIKQSGPSPGDGHKFTDSDATRHAKDEGVRTGARHGFTSSGNMAHVMDSGPSDGGAGH